MYEVIIVGAGLAGLSFARTWKEAGGGSVLIVDKSRGVGGRCATRRVEGQPVDHGLSFLHGSHVGFVAACRAAGNGEAVEGWPRVVSGEGRPCQPRAFHLHEQRFAFPNGLSSFPKSLTKNVELKLRTRVASLELRGGAIRLETEDGVSLASRNVILATPLEQARALLRTLDAAEARRELEGLGKLFGTLRSEPSLTLLAGYGLDTRPPDWDMLYPEASDAASLVSHDSSKRPDKRFHVLVVQATARFSRRHLEDEPVLWSTALLDDAARHVGDWCRRPVWTQSHRWRFARVDAAACLSQPVRIALGARCGIGLVGEAFLPGGGAEAAFLSGQSLAERLLGERDL